MAFDEDVPKATNQISADLTQMNANWEYVILGDGTAGRVLRSSTLKVENGTTGNTLKCTLTSRWNGDAISATDDIAKSATTGDFSLNVNGAQLTIEASGLSGNVIAVLASQIYANASTTVFDISASHYNNDILITFYNSSTGAGLDTTVLVDTGLFI